MLGYLIHKGFGNLDVVTEHFVITDAERANAGFFALLLGNLFKPRVAILHNFTQGVKLLTVSRGDHFALANGKGGRFYDRSTNARTYIIECIELLTNVNEPLAFGT